MAVNIKEPICIRCKKRCAAPNATHCTDCISYKKCYVQNRYDIRKLNKLCTNCGKVKVEKFVMCWECRKKKSRIFQREKSRAAAGE